jgi:SsrA-binding protein
MAKEEKVLAANRAAFHNYHISDKYEAGIVLTGTEVKSAMGGRVQLKEAYVSVREGEAWLFNAHISPYSHGNRENHDPLRTRKLLLHKREISRLDEATRGKKLYDKRETELKRTVDRETRAQLKERNR